MSTIDKINYKGTLLDIADAEARADVSDLKSAVDHTLIKLETDENFSHENLTAANKITFIGNTKAFRTAKYANKINYYPKQNYEETKGNVAYVGDGCFWTLNGTSNASSTYNASYQDYDPPVPAGTYTMYCEIDIGDSESLAGLQFGLNVKYSDNTTAQKNTYIKDADKTVSITFDKPVSRIQAIAGNISGCVFNNYKVWFGLFDSSVQFVDTNETVESDGELEVVLSGADIAGIDTCQHTSIVSYIADTKKYIDDKEIDIDEELTYITPERFGAVGDGTTDDYQAFVDCIAYAVQHGVPIRGHGFYYISNGIVIEGDDLDIYINRITSDTTTSDSVVKLIGNRNRVKINYIYAYSGNCNGFYLFGKTGHWTEFNTIAIPYVCAKQNAILIDADNGAYACENVFHTQYLRSREANCIYAVYGFGENVFYGGGQIICPNGWAIKVHTSGCKFYNFALESNARSGIYISCYNTFASGLRIAELRGQKTALSGDVGTVVKFVGGDAFANIIEFADIVNTIDIDASEATPVEDLPTDSIGGNNPQVYNIIRGTGVRGCGYDTSAKGYYANYGKELIVLHDKKIVVPYGLMQIDVDSDVDYTTDDYAKVLSNFFVIKAESTITLNDSYCPIGFNEIYIDQTDAKVIIYKGSNIIFNGNNYGNNVYKLICYSDMKNNDFNTKHPSSTQTQMYDGTNEVWKVLNT